MSNTLDYSPLLLAFKTIQHNNNKRIISFYKNSYTPPISLSHYESYLSQKTNSYSAVKTELLWLSYIFTWSSKFGYDIESDLLSGNSPSKTKINAFSYWLRNRGSIKTSSKLTIKYVNTILTATSSMYCWFIELYGKFPGTANEVALNRAIVTKSVKEQFKKLKRKSRKIKTAPDLSEDEISKIECFLKPENRMASLKKEKLTPSVKSSIYRDYLVWHLTIEFGVRISEVLALRIEDCPNGAQNYIKIVRTNERGDDYFDKRTPPPAPKTLSRDLGFLFKDSIIPDLIIDYCTEHRRRTRIKHGRKIRPVVIDIGTPQFLILAHQHDKGTPLTISGAEEISQLISRKTGVKFHWHLARHAFFNRAYDSIINHPDYKDRKQDLVLWGGWESEKSLEIYIKRARQEKAQKALQFWQEGQNSWDAIS